MRLSKLNDPSGLFQKLRALRPLMAAAAQEVYDQWEQTEEDSGGLCSEIANALGEVVNSHIPDARITQGGHDGDDHDWIIVFDNYNAFGVDIPYDIYEIDHGMWDYEKINDVVFTPEDVSVTNLGIDPKQLREE